MNITPVNYTNYNVNNNYHTNFKAKQSMTVMKNSINNLPINQGAVKKGLFASIITATATIIASKSCSETQNNANKKNIFEIIRHNLFLNRTNKLVPAETEKSINYKAIYNLIKKTSDTNDLNYLFNKLKNIKTNSAGVFQQAMNLTIMIAEKTAPQFRKDFIESIPEKYREIAKEVVADKNILYKGGETHNSDNTGHKVIDALKLDIMEKCGYYIDYEAHGRYISTSSLTDFTLNGKKLNQDMIEKINPLTEWLCVDKLWNWFVDDNKDLTKITQPD